MLYVDYRKECLKHSKLANSSDEYEYHTTTITKFLLICNTLSTLLRRLHAKGKKKDKRIYRIMSESFIYLKILNEFHHMAAGLRLWLSLKPNFNSMNKRWPIKMFLKKFWQINASFKGHGSVQSFVHCF